MPLKIVITLENKTAHSVAAEHEDGSQFCARIGNSPYEHLAIALEEIRKTWPSQIALLSIVDIDKGPDVE